MEWPSRGRLPTASLPEVAVFVSGVSSMGLEILAGRIVAPQYGSSIYTWGSIIGVFLLALSLGYIHGGKRAAERATVARIAWLLLVPAAYIAVVVFAHDRLVVVTGGLGLPTRFASLPAVLVLFGPPTYILGYISPYAAELSNAESTGAASGHIYAVGTVGSIIGAFGTTFLLIPTLSIETIGLILGLLLVAAALWTTVTTYQTRTVAATLLIGTLLVTSASAGTIGVSAGGPVVYETQTPYQQLEVTDFAGTRTLYLDGQPHSAMDLDEPNRHVFAYTRYFHLPFLMTDDIDRVLFIGGGGFTGPKRFVADYDVTVDVVEIDPGVIEAAEQYFGVERSDDLRIHQGDGRAFLRETDEQYDLIVLDAYKKDKVPFQLTTVEFMRLADRRLTDDGVLLANLISSPSGPASKFYRAEYRTIDTVFPQVYAFPTSRGDTVQNIELVATKRTAHISQAELARRNAKRDIGIDLADAVTRYQDTVRTDDVPVLRDDHAPVDRLVDPMIGQQYVVVQTDPSNATGWQGTPSASSRPESAVGDDTGSSMRPAITSGNESVQRHHVIPTRGAPVRKAPGRSV